MESKTFTYSLALIEKPGNSGLDRKDLERLTSHIDSGEFYPIEIENSGSESCAMGFITPEFAEFLDYDYKSSGLNDFVGGILADMEKESPDCRYTFKDHGIWLSR